MAEQFSNVCLPGPEVEVGDFALPSPVAGGSAGPEAQSLEQPEWARDLGRRLVNEGLMRDLPDQVIVNEYRGKQGISRHIDQPRSFAEHVATISLIETWGMVFRRRGSKEKIEKPLERRRVAVLTGDARYKWTHEIPSNRANEPRMEQGKRRWVKRTRRISLTFRTVRLERNA